jgi:hypothetical protein
MSKSLAAVEEETFSQNARAQVPPADIVAYNELRSCADLYRMYDQGILDIQPEFQREVVWKSPAQTRFIDSLVKQLPIPSMCFAMDYDAQKWIVIDGLQRISTIIHYLEGKDWKLSTLDDIEQEISGKLASEIKFAKGPLHRFYTRVENLSIPITVLRCDFAKKSHMDYLFTIFHRLNTGGVKLNNQEIRNCIYGGTLNSLLKDLDQNPKWRRINKMKLHLSGRFAKQEIILRAFAFHDRLSTYEGDLAGFLNDYMQDHRNASAQFLKKKEELFHRTVDCIADEIFDGESPSKLSVTVLEALLVGVSKNLDVLSPLSRAVVKQRYATLVSDPEFSDAALREGLSKKPRVISRLNAAIRIFAGK